MAHVTTLAPAPARTSRIAALGAGWAVASGFCWLFMFAAYFFGAVAVISLIGGDPDTFLDGESAGAVISLIAMYALGGLGWAGAQVLFLRRWLPQTRGTWRRWIVGGVAGWLAYIVASGVAYSLMPAWLGATVALLVAGPVLGVVQAPTARRRGLGAREWIVVGCLTFLVYGLVEVAAVVWLTNGDNSVAGGIGAAVAAVVPFVALALGRPATAGPAAAG